MPLNAENEKLALIDKVAAAAVKAKIDEHFVRTFYRNVPPDDILPRPPAALVAGAEALWQFMAERRPGKAKIRVLSPADKANGWTAGRTVVQIVNDDMPFLVDSVTACLNALELVVHLVIHPVMPVLRAAGGKLIAVDETNPDALSESVMQIEIAGRIDAELEKRVVADLERVLGDVRAAVVDWEAMSKKVGHIADDIGNASLPVPASEAVEVSAFLTWLTDRNFTFLGYREYAIDKDGMKVVPGAGRGVLRDDSYLVFDGLRNFTALSPDVQQFLRSPQLMQISKSNRRSTVHRPVQFDTIGIKTFNAEGEVVGQKLIVGLFTTAAYAKSPRSIPVLRRKVQRTVERSGFAPDSHDGKALQHIVDSFPRDELFQIAETDLFSTAIGILNLQERQRIAAFTRRDPFERFVSCLVYVPRDRYNSAVRRRMAQILETAFNGKLTSDSVQLDESVLARIHFIINTNPGQVPDVDPATLEKQLVEAGRVWADKLGEALGQSYEEGEAQTLLRRFADAFPTNYTERFTAQSAVYDIQEIATLEAGAPVALALYHTPDAGPSELRLKTFSIGKPIPLSDVLPMLENLGMKVITENPFRVKPRDAETKYWVQEFELVTRGQQSVDLDEVGPRFEEAFPAVYGGAVEDDGFNRLVVLAGLAAREIIVLRTYCKILRQAGSTFSQPYMEDTLSAHPAIAHKLVRLFETQFDPALKTKNRDAAADKLAAGIEQDLDQVSNLDEDRILRSFLLLIRKSLRTNFYQPGADGKPKPYLSVKLASQEIDLLPQPRPLVEIFVYSPRMEGCHLRGGRVARGGIRWSDRKEDFRTEILGLMKAQQVKNSVIVPVGSKGGFVVKRPATGDREAVMAEVVACYKTLMYGLLDLTDTIAGPNVVPPKSVVRRDGDDPYLVVAADKGTATFSDIANGCAIEYGFWLGDAFASGGSIGYDHKAMGITARGAWEAVKRHFRELGTDIQTTDFTSVGVGDMAGDVFGNGMLLSKHTRLIAAFNHMHIFIDPEPDAAKSWVERKRLFDLPRSTWNDYDRKLLSKGGAIYERSAKSLTLSPEAQARLGLKSAAITPNDLIRVLLKLPVDLLWFGGIGTYVKASTESQAEAGDRANDALRINGREIVAKVVGEGANLALTQRGRIEYALAGGRLNTDAIDNSAGVDTSDHEVNIKIGAGAMLTSGKLKADKRNAFLGTMTDEVAELVLEDNYLQTLALSIAEAEAPTLLDEHTRLMRSLERAGKLDRAIEFLPDDEALTQRAAAKRGLTRPELSVLMAYAKNAIYAELLTTDLPDEPELEEELLGYFPRQMVQLSKADLKAHRLRREIVATVVTNAMINRLGPSFVSEMQSKTGRSTEEVTRAYRITRVIFDLPSLWRSIEALDNVIPAAVQTKLFLAVRTVAEQSARWFLQSGQNLSVTPRIKEFGPGIKALAAKLVSLLPESERAAHEARVAAYVAQGVPTELAERVVALDSLSAAMDIVRIDEGTKLDIVELGRLYFATGARLGLATLREKAHALPAATPWQRLAIGALADDFSAMQREIVGHVLAESDGAVAGRLEAWTGRRADAMGKVQEMVADVTRISPPDLAMLTVVGRQLRALTV
ncbi:glutamate dehydrogenase [Aliidongia dinghuensis]|uniref:Glutamate dehydrogenase n=1 Tax=Aliidongia dinghuensis TaxID=1867774 RepID=A0A8J2YWA7_9PROT|nr:NAD-glutamate dehydrogenase [Aliidongia dinghuensis]GGF31171.1 glutamate dehydrogenase [Aliidongia dinghuensis]